MKNSVHDNGGFIGRVADYAATDYYISTTTVSGVSSTLNYEWYNHNRGSPTTEATMDQFFDVSQSDVSLGGTGSWTTDINWSDNGTSSTTVSKPSYLPTDKYALKLSGNIIAPETGTYTKAKYSQEEPESNIFVDSEFIVKDIDMTKGVILGIPYSLKRKNIVVELDPESIDEVFIK